MPWNAKLWGGPKRIYIQLVVSWRSTGDLIMKIWIFNFFSQCWRERHQPQIALRHHIGYGRVGYSCLMTWTKRNPKMWWLRDTFKIIQNGTYLLSLGALKQHNGLRWCSGTYPTWHPRRSDPIRKLNGKLEGSGKGWSTWHRINCETGKILPFPTITVGVACYTQKNGRLFVGNGDVIKKISLEDPPENHSWIPFQGTKSASRESKQCYTRRS